MNYEVAPSTNCKIGTREKKPLDAGRFGVLLCFQGVKLTAEATE